MSPSSASVAAAQTAGRVVEAPARRVSPRAVLSNVSAAEAGGSAAHPGASATASAAVATASAGTRTKLEASRGRWRRTMAQ